jgi:hypothetical protein
VTSPTVTGSPSTAADGVHGYCRALRDTELRNPDRVSGYGLAKADARLGQTHEAIALIDRAFRDREGWSLYVNINPQFDGLRGDSRFNDIVARMGLPEGPSQP